MARTGEGDVIETLESIEDKVNDFFSHDDDENKNIFLTTDSFDHNNNNNNNYSNNDNYSQHSRIKSQVAIKKAPHLTQSKQPTSMSNTTRRPVNTNTDANIYDINSNGTRPETNTNINNQRASTNGNYTYQPQQQQIKNQQMNNKNQVNKNQIPNKQQSHASQNNNSNRTPISPTNINNPNTTSSGTPTYGGTRIAKRELWWKEPPASEVKITTGRKLNLENVSPRVDHHNKNYQPSRESSKIIENRKLEWNAKAVTDTWGNFQHQPGGGRKRYPQEDIRWNALPKTDCGFIYTYE